MADSNLGIGPGDAYDEDDVSTDYMYKSDARRAMTDAAEMRDWVRQTELENAVRDQPIPVGDKPQRELPRPKPIRQPTDDPTIGRREVIDESTTGSVMRNVAEIGPQAVGGVEDAMVNSGLFSLIDPMAQWLNDNVADLRYGGVDKAKTAAGSITRKVSEFLTGFVPALRGLRAMGMSGNVAAPMLAGAIADFTVRDPHEARLADLFREKGLPDNIVTDYLASNPEDSNAEARFKNVLEGMALGTAFEGVLMGARALRAARNTPGVKEAEEQILRAKYGEVSDEQVRATIGDSTAPIVGTKPTAAPAVKEADAPALDPRSLVKRAKGQPLPDDWQVYVNFNGIDAPDKIKFAIGKMAEAMKGKIDEATRGTITHEETKRLAEDMGMSVDQLLARRSGQVFNAEEALAARQLWVASGEKLVELAKKAASANAGALDQFAFRRAMTVHSAIQAEVLGARTETARALNAWKIPADSGGIERARAIQQVLNVSGGEEMSKEMARRLAILADNADPATVAKFAERGAAASTMDAVREIWINGLLSSPKTHAVNVMSNTMVALQSVYERAAAGGIRAAIGGDGTQMGEAVAMTFGLVEGVKDGFRMAAKALKTGESQFQINSKVDLTHTNAVSAAAFKQEGTALGHGLDMIGTVANVPTRLLGAEDEFFKSVGYRMELWAQALRHTTQEGLSGEAAGKRIAEILKNPPEHIRINAADAALYNTFTSEVGAFGQAIMNLRNIDHPANPLIFVLPFVRTPVNIARYAFERTPFAPLVSQWRADVAAGGARADLAMARMSTGTMIMLAAMDFADSGMITGEGPREKDKDTREALLRQGWQPYSVRVGDKWYSYNRADPFGMTVGFAASIAEAVRKGELDGNDVDEWNEVTAMAIAAVSQVTISKTYLEGFAKFVEVMSDPKRYSQKYVDDLFASFLPATSLNSAIKNFVDPVQREYGTPMEAVQARIAGLSKDLPPRRDLWGEVITSESGTGKVYDFMSPIAVKQRKNSPIDQEMVRLNAAPLRIQKQSSFDGVQVNMRRYPEVYDEYTRLAGNALKHPAWNMGAKDYLNAVVSGAHPMSESYRIMSDESRAAFISNTVSQYRQLAQREILSNPKYKNFAAEVSYLKQMQMNSKMPVMGETQ